MNVPAPEDVLEQALQVARLAGETIAGIYRQGFDVEYKGRNDPVTTADKVANELIVSELSNLFPGTPIVAEESRPSSFAAYRSAEQVFFVDPLDGTRDFIKQNGEFVVMIGLVCDNRAEAGVVLAPLTMEAWIGSLDGGAFHVRGDGTRTPISPSPVTELSEATLVASRSHAREAVEKATLLLGVREVQPLGSAGLKGARVAEGHAEMYLSPTTAGKRWDACAVDAILTAAGGRFSDAHGERLDYRDADLTNRRGVLATNGPLHEAALSKLDQLRSR